MLYNESFQMLDKKGSTLSIKITKKVSLHKSQCLQRYKFIFWAFRLFMQTIFFSYEKKSIKIFLKNTKDVGREL